MHDLLLKDERNKKFINVLLILLCIFFITTIAVSVYFYPYMNYDFWNDYISYLGGNWPKYNLTIENPSQFYFNIGFGICATLMLIISILFLRTVQKDALENGKAGILFIAGVGLGLMILFPHDGNVPYIHPIAAFFFIIGLEIFCILCFKAKLKSEKDIQDIAGGKFWLLLNRLYLIVVFGLTLIYCVIWILNFFEIITPIIFGLFVLPFLQKVMLISIVFGILIINRNDL